MKIYKIIFMILLGLPFMAGLAKAKILEFEPLTPETMAKYDLSKPDVKDLKEYFHFISDDDSEVKTEDIIIAKDNDIFLLLQRSGLSCGSAACSADGFQKKDGKLIFDVYPPGRYGYDCSDNDEEIICSVFNKELFFHPLDENIKVPVGAKRPYISYIEDYSILFLDAIEDCFNSEGCNPTNVEIKNGEIVIGDPFPGIRCFRPDENGNLKCAASQDFDIFYSLGEWAKPEVKANQKD